MRLRDEWRIGLIYTAAIMGIRKILRYRVYLALVLLYAIAVVALCSLAPAIQQPVQLDLDEVSQEPAPSSSQPPQTLPSNFNGFDESKQQSGGQQSTQGDDLRFTQINTSQEPALSCQLQPTNRRAPLWALGAGYSLNFRLFAAEQAELIGLVLLVALVYRFRLPFMNWGRAIATFVGFRRSGTCVWLGFLVVLLLTMFPPWVQSKTYGGRLPTEHVKLWHAPIFRAPVAATRLESSDVDYARMLTEIVVGECFVLALYLTWARTRLTDKLKG